MYLLTCLCSMDNIRVEVTIECVPPCCAVINPKFIEKYYYRVDKLINVTIMIF